MSTSLKITSVRAQALDVMSIELRDPQGAMLPAFTPGAHLELEVQSPDARGRPFVRHYSLCNNAQERDRYVIAVARLDTGRGGSIALHDLAHAGLILNTRGPHNNFPLVEDANFYRFIAGGIGITPILSMLRWCMDHGKNWSFLYCTRSKNRAAFYDVLQEFGDRVRYHFDDERNGELPDIAGELTNANPGEHVYCCGPNPLMKAVERQAAGRPEGSVHFEWFAADGVSRPSAKPAGEFDVILKRSGMRLSIPSDKSILDVLEANGLAIPFSCREGVCRSCETPLCSGEADHRDYVLSAAEQAANRSLIICVSRAKSDVLELDI